MSTHVITDQDRRAMYGSCVVCRAPRDAVQVTWEEGGETTVTMALVCTASFPADPTGQDWGHRQDAGPILPELD